MGGGQWWWQREWGQVGSVAILGRLCFLGPAGATSRVPLTFISVNFRPYRHLIPSLAAGHSGETY